MIAVGIDPGKNGGISAINKRGDILVSVVMPTAGGEISPHGIAAVLHAIFYEGSGQIVIEHSQAIHKSAAGATFSFGVNFGILQGVCAAAAYPYILVKPKAWQKSIHQGTDGDPKDRSLQAVYRLFPKASLLASAKCRKPHDGIVDSLLLAEYCRRLSVS